MSSQPLPYGSLPSSRAAPDLGVRERIPTLDGLRGLAIALVMVNHFTLFGGWKPEAGIDRVAFAIGTTGWWGVDLFFVLSGFLITGILLDTKSAPGYFRNFYIRRVLRIFPLYYGTLAALSWLPGLAGSAPSAYLHREAGWFWGYAVNLQYALEGWPAAPSEIGLGPYWSLAVEEQFYLVWPVVILLCHRATLARVCLLLVAVSILLRINLTLSDHTLAAYVLTPARMEPLAIGALVAIVVRIPGGILVARRWAVRLGPAAGVGLTALLILLGELSPESQLGATWGLTLAGLLSGAILVSSIAARPDTPFHRLFTTPALVFLGRYSYGLYVFHLLLTIALAEQAFSISDLPTIAGSRLPGLAAFSLVAATASIVLAVVSWHLWEQPFLELKRFFPRPERRGARMRNLGRRGTWPAAGSTTRWSVAWRNCRVRLLGADKPE